MTEISRKAKEVSLLLPFVAGTGHHYPRRSEPPLGMRRLWTPLETMTGNEALKKFGLPASPHSQSEIRRLLAEEIEREKRGESGDEMLRTLCVQLFSLGSAEDALLVWDARQSSFDAGCGLDVQLLCAGLPATKALLAKSGTPSAAKALKYLTECELAGDFVDWTPSSTLDQYRDYYGSW